MIVTEAEAKTKRCPEIARAAAIANTVVSTGMNHMSYAVPCGPMMATLDMCLASGCMAWCWFDNRADQAIKEPRGYCGKAGAGNE